VNSRKKTLTGITVLCVLALNPSYLFCFAQTQTETVFYSTDEFGIPAYNSKITFAVGGTYSLANLKNDSWTFQNLRIGNLGSPVNLTVSTQNSNVTIVSYQKFNTTIVGSRLRYTVVGLGEQTFNLGLNAKGGDWSVILNGKYMSLNDGWSMLPDQTITVTGATANVTIVYYDFAASIRATGDDFQQHSVAITTGAAVAITVVFAVLIKLKNPRDETENPVNNNPIEKNAGRKIKDDL
jgi:hypothetical protein